ncbi:MAG: 5'/3'-nucleotidase SurE [Sphingobacteriales bacterium]|nr:MAG: 5'/3'-nucleotidase SurE [Sphingobacteriales bacterium]
MQRPVILVSNDDSINAPGIKALVEVAKKFGDVVVVAPDSPQSGMGHAITIHEPLRLNKIGIFEDVEAYQCSGTPADCVKIAIDKILHRKPDLCISGINHGSNASINVIYSGTMSAAMEAAIDGIPAIGFSLLDFAFDADFTAAKHYAEIVIRELLNNGLPNACLLNVNIPKMSLQDIKGMRVCRQAVAKWEEEFDKRVDPNGSAYYWLTGKFENKDKGEDTDVWALDNGYVSIVPVQFDLTNYHGITFINNNWNIHE